MSKTALDNKVTKPEKLVLTLDSGALPSGKFIAAVTSFFRILNSVADSATHTKNAVEWLVEVKRGSAIIQAEAVPNNVDMRYVSEAVHAITSGLDALEAGQRERPPHFTDEAMKAVRTLSSLSSSDVFVKVTANDFVARLSTQTVASVNSVLEASYSDYGSIEGKLEVVSIRQSPKFNLYDDLTDQAVVCHFEEIWLPDVMAAFDRRVSVWGDIRYRKDGLPVNIQVEGFRVFGTENELPSINDIVGILGSSA